MGNSKGTPASGSNVKEFIDAEIAANEVRCPCGMRLPLSPA